MLLTGCGPSTHSDSLSGIPRSLLRAARPIGLGPRFQPPVTGSAVGGCRRELGPRRGVHVEVFVANRVLITHVTIFIGARPWRGTPGSVPLTPHAEIVLETGPRVPPHRSFTFPPGT